jgi:hypothetical protein
MTKRSYCRAHLTSHKKKARNARAFFNKISLVRRRMTATLFIGMPPAVIAPYRITQIQIAGIGGRADRCTTNGANHGARRSTAGCGANERAGTCAQQTAGRSPIARGRTAAGKGQYGNRRSYDGETSHMHYCLLTCPGNNGVSARRVPAAALAFPQARG